jgi:hypothetical protein
MILSGNYYGFNAQNVIARNVWILSVLDMSKSASEKDE